MSENLFTLIDKDIPRALQIIGKKNLKGYKGMYADLHKEFIQQPNGFSLDRYREKLKVFVDLLNLENKNEENTDKERYLISQFLLALDFISQKEKLKQETKGKPINFILLQGTPECGLNYFVMHNHPKSSRKYLKAENVLFPDSENEWTPILNIFNITNIDPKSTIKHIPTVIGDQIERELKEKPLVIIIYGFESWGDNYLKPLKNLLKRLRQIPVENVTHSLYWYFVYTGGYQNHVEQELIVMPPVEYIGADELKQLYLNFYHLFEGCTQDISSLLSGPKKLPQVIDIFTQFSSNREEIRTYLNEFHLD
jgi:hypothetical protein